LAAVDVERIVALLTDDAILTMPPIDVRIAGGAAVGEFFATEPLGGQIERIALVPTRASGQPGFACTPTSTTTGSTTPTASWSSRCAATRSPGSPGVRRSR
jgi:ketosteroid isomerase-like protein